MKPWRFRSGPPKLKAIELDSGELVDFEIGDWSADEALVVATDVRTNPSVGNAYGVIFDSTPEFLDYQEDQFDSLDFEGR
ncbi:hypothetical protein Acr_00g0066370 [Actinidia rufa]|uniref:Uncharacterized protein n=1 Tax=Actinidia rufa TaxID=165716 RepID=A0A7J0DQB7_9ERIC|nr:hypothetical protein Acr_00g0066370 [Actinidia rufa]